MQDARVEALSEALVAACRQALGDTLTGLYVHGSLGFGCFRWEVSDVDFLIVVETPPPVSAKADLVRRMAIIESNSPPKGLEMSLLLRRDCAAIVHPMPYLLHYSPAHREAALKDADAYVDHPMRHDPDLAAHITVLHHAGYALYGPPVGDVFGPVAPQAYLDSILQDIADAPHAILNAPVYTTLNLCRVLAYARENLVLSKAQGGVWGMQNLPVAMQPPIEYALARYQGNDATPEPPADALISFARDMLANIGISG